MCIRDSSRWPLYEGAPGHGTDDQRLRLVHTQEDMDNGVRAFCADVMAAVPCHQDWQTSDGEALL
eukprot:1647740-Alexandrium_andersonii.AAC.1